MKRFDPAKSNMHKKHIISYDVGSGDHSAIVIGRIEKGETLTEEKLQIMINDYYKGECTMKKVRKKKLTKDQAVIEKLDKEIADFVTQLRSATYRETDLTRKLAAMEKERDAASYQAKENRSRINAVNTEVSFALQSLEATPIAEQDSRHLQRIIGIVQGRLSSIVTPNEYYAMRGINTHG